VLLAVPIKELAAAENIEMDNFERLRLDDGQFS
jgi:hypothetical protein